MFNNYGKDYDNNISSCLDNALNKFLMEHERF